MSPIEEHKNLIQNSWIVLEMQAKCQYACSVKTTKAWSNTDLAGICAMAMLVTALHAITKTLLQLDIEEYRAGLLSACCHQRCGSGDLSAKSPFALLRVRSGLTFFSKIAIKSGKRVLHSSSGRSRKSITYLLWAWVGLLLTSSPPI